MQTIEVAHTDLKVSRICFGTMTFGGQADETESARMVDACLDAGIQFFDTANVYNAGESERILGRALGKRRSRVVLASKVRGKMGDAADEQGLSRAAIFKAIDASLARLGTDYLDIYYLHMPDRSVPIEETLEAMEALVRTGKVRWPAISNYSAWEACRIHWICERRGFRPPCVSQPMYNLLARAIEEEFLPMSRERGISNFVYNPLAGGLLTGKQRRDRPEPGTRFDNPKMGQMYRDRYWHPADFDAVDRLERAAREAGRTLLSVALNWILHHTPVEGMILGASRTGQLEENLRALEDGPLPDELLAECDRVWEQLRGVTPKYHR